MKNTFTTIDNIQNPQRSDSKPKNISPTASRIKQQPMPLNQLMLKLGNYRELKQLPLNTVSQQKQQLWRQSPCTVRCSNRHISLDKIQRFHIGSIYFKDDINQQKKVFTQSQKPELILKNFRRQIEEASLTKRKKSESNSKHSPERQRNHSFLGKTLPVFQNKLYQVPQKIELKYDRNGTRSSYVGQYDVKKIMQNLRQTAKNFSSSRRKDLALPLNFNPGPGEYFTKSSDFMTQRSQRSRKDTFRAKIKEITE